MSRMFCFVLFGIFGQKFGFLVVLGILKALFLIFKTTAKTIKNTMFTHRKLFTIWLQSCLKKIICELQKAHKKL